MHFVLVLVAEDLRASHLAKVEAFLDDCHIRFSTSPKWLNPHKAAEIAIDDKPLPDQWQKLRNLLTPDEIDVFVVPTDKRRKKLLLADMDATIVTGETLDELAGYAGFKDKVSEITQRAMRGELDFPAALTERVAMLKDLPVSVLQTTLDATELSEGAETLVKVMAANGAVCVLVSGGFTFFTAAIAKRAGFHFNHGNTLEFESDVLNGTVAAPILDKDAKKKFLLDYVSRTSLSLNDTIAIGDGANDLPMLQEAGLGIGYHPKPLLIENLDNCIIHSDLTAALYIQGYTWQEIESVINSKT